MKVKSKPQLAPVAPSRDPLLAAAATLTDLEHLLGVTLTIHDFGALFRRPAGGQVPKQVWRHRHPYCELGRQANADWDRACLKHCGRLVNERVGAGGDAVVHTCWKGVTEVAVPLFGDGVHAGTVFAGGRRRAGTRPPRGLPGHVVTQWRRLPVLSSADAERIARTLAAAANGLVRLLELPPATADSQDDRRATVSAFLRHHGAEAIGLGDMAAALHLSPSRASHLVRELFHVPFQRLLQEERLRRAAFLLTHSRLRLAEVARRSGFANEYYFSRVFRRQHRLPPGAYRRQHGGGRSGRG